MKQLRITTNFTNRHSASFNQYLKEIAKIEMFTPAQETLCAQRVAAGDKDAIDELVRRNLRFVVSVAKKYVNSDNSLEDLVNEGNIGLILAAEKFNLEMGVKFISYAVWWIRKVIMEHVSKHGRIIRFPANKINSLSKLKKQISDMEQKLGRDIDIQEIIDEYGSELGLDGSAKYANDYELLDVLGGYTIDSLNRPLLHSDESEATLEDTLTDESIYKQADHDIITQDIKNELNNVLKVLKPRDRKVIIALYGLDGSIPRTQIDIAEEIGVTREMVRQIQDKSLKKLRAKLDKSAIY